MSNSVSVVSHWHLLIDDYQTSAMEFYSLVETSLAKRLIPDVAVSRVEWKEGGLLTAKREYLRAKRGDLIFDIGAAPFGTGYFFSWWLVQESPRHVLLCLLLSVFSILALLVASTSLLGVFFGLLAAPFVVIGAMLIIFPLIRDGAIPGQESLAATPVVGRIYQRFFVSSTYFALDTKLMYQESVHRAVLSVIEELRSGQGLRALSQDEIRPLTRNLLQ